MTGRVAHASIVYWRRSIWIGRRCVPVAMTLDDGWLRARDAGGGELFAVPAGRVRGRLSRLGTLLLTVDGRRYALVGRGADNSPEPSAEQRRAVTAFWAVRPAPGPAGGPGLLDQIFNGSAAWHTRTWRDVLAAAGADLRR
ncbi:hypothetical protein K7640_29120 [Micromonospora sp. PLK6-60]|uniref:hypothetical protein n=1 Tax=Micromonospora sp. PLK6-60 TaxID=2873383 RepID=UPI001CA6C242|nr:hypothetical protein [Micromonospora sp. PLK6-60]MBY8875897.1 hypothetical protein [Micromonospora sp. PLK6-60]